MFYFILIIFLFDSLLIFCSFFPEINDGYKGVGKDNNLFPN